MSERRSYGGDRGIALLNALILVAAIASVAALMTQRAASGFHRIATMQNLAQARQYLRSAVYQTAHALEIDAAQSKTDHLSENWAQTEQVYSFEQGRVSVRLSDLQGRFNVNWLSFENDHISAVTWEHLSARAGLHISTALEIQSLLRPRPLPGAQRYLNRAIPMRPEGGPIAIMEQIRLAEQVGDEHVSALAHWIAALPANTAINVNTMPAEVLSAFLPGLSPDAVKAFVRQRDRAPFATVDAFRDRLQRSLGAQSLGAFPRERLQVSTDWFEVTATARVGDTVLRQQIILHRAPLGETVEIAYRLAETADTVETED
ncbi:MAG: type II secretion system minor pseudopilin GspK [Brevirhabdus sp.]